MSGTIPWAAARQAPAVTATADYVAEIDALRGAAVLAVLVNHCQILHFGWTGVWLFFVISGFAITTSLLNSSARQPRPGPLLYNFYLRRSLRIWPLFFAHVGIVSVLLLAFGMPQPLAELPWILTFTQNFAQIFRDPAAPEVLPFVVLWTLAAEEQFYLLYPPLFALLARRELVRALLVIMALAPVWRVLAGSFAATAGWDIHDVGRTIYNFSPGHFDAFSVGCLLAIFRPQLEGRLALARAVFWTVLLAIACYALGYLQLFLGQGMPLAEALRSLFHHHMVGYGREVLLYWLVWGLAASLVLLILARDPLTLKLCRFPGLQAIGRVSFGAYLFHSIVIMLLVTQVPWFQGGGNAMAQPQRLALLAITLPVTLALSFASYHWFEQRFLRLRHRFG